MHSYILKEKGKAQGFALSSFLHTQTYCLYNYRLFTNIYIAMN